MDAGGCSIAFSADPVHLCRNCVGAGRAVIPSR